MEIVESFFRMSKAIRFGMNFSTNKITVQEGSYLIFMEIAWCRNLDTYPINKPN